MNPLLKNYKSKKFLAMQKNSKFNHSVRMRENGYDTEIKERDYNFL